MNEKEKTRQDLVDLFKEPFKNFGGCLFWIIVIIVIAICIK